MRDLLSYFLFLGYGFLMCYLGYDYHKDTHKCPEIKQEIKVKDTLPELTLDNVLKEIINQDIKYPLIVYRQVIWETGWLRCKDCSLDYNNLFGMGWNGNSYHSYNYWTESIRAYKIWQLKYYKGGDYYQFLEDIGYAEDEKNYTKNLKFIKI